MGLDGLSTPRSGSFCSLLKPPTCSDMGTHLGVPISECFGLAREVLK